MSYSATVNPDTQATCWTLVRDAANGVSGARAEFSDFYGSVVRGFVAARWRPRGVGLDVEDAVQEIFVECFKPGGVLERADPSKGDFRGLLYGVSRNVVLRFEERAVERGRIRPEDSAWLQEVASDDKGQETLFERSWAHSVMAEAMVRLRQAAEASTGASRRVKILERRFTDNIGIRDIAAEWGVPAQDVHNDYRKAREEFYRSLKSVVGYHAPRSDVAGECRRLLSLLSA